MVGHVARERGYRGGLLVEVAVVTALSLVTLGMIGPALYGWLEYERELVRTQETLESLARAIDRFHRDASRPYVYDHEGAVTPATLRHERGAWIWGPFLSVATAEPNNSSVLEAEVEHRWEFESEAWIWKRTRRGEGRTTSEVLLRSARYSPLSGTTGFSEFFPDEAIEARWFECPLTEGDRLFWVTTAGLKAPRVELPVGNRRLLLKPQDPVEGVLRLQSSELRLGVRIGRHAQLTEISLAVRP